MGDCEGSEGDGRGGGGEANRAGHRAVGRMWRRFGSIGLMEVKEFTVDRVGGEYRRRLMRATRRVVEAGPEAER